jgi:hypothetical protein
MGHKSEEQWEVIGYCANCGAAFWAMGEHTKWNDTYCDGDWCGHVLEEVDDGIH